MLNRVVMIGRLTRDPELKYTPQGVPVATFGIAVQRYTKNETGDYDVDFFNVTAWRRTAEFVQNYVTKGRLVALEGRLQTRSWVDQASGQKRTNFEIVADNVEALERRTDGEAPQAESGGERSAPARASAPRPTTPGPDIDETDPFADE
jgi:single-strand DNA-binding protein